MPKFLAGRPTLTMAISSKSIHIDALIFHQQCYQSINSRPFSSGLLALLPDVDQTSNLLPLLGGHTG